jgi:hypothetical protein
MKTGAAAALLRSTDRSETVTRLSRLPSQLNPSDSPPTNGGWSGKPMR